MILSNCIHYPENVKASFLLAEKFPLLIFFSIVYFPKNAFYMHSSILGHLACFQNLATVSATISTDVQGSLRQIDVDSFKHVLRSGMVGSYVGFFYFFWGISIACGLTYIPSSHPCQCLLLFVFFISVILSGVIWNVNILRIFISLMTSEVELFCSCVYWPFVFHLLRAIFISLAQLLFALFHLWSKFYNPLCILGISPLPNE